MTSKIKGILLVKSLSNLKHVNKILVSVSFFGNLFPDVNLIHMTNYSNLPIKKVYLK